MITKVLLEGMLLGILLMGVCAVGIRNGAVGMVDAHQNDYHIHVVTDAVAGSSKEAHDGALRAIYYLQHDALITTADVEATLKSETEPEDEMFMREAIHLSRLAVEHGNEPFGAVLVKDGKIVFSNEN